jgi:hypothetical protein
MSTRILQDDEVTQAGDIYAYVNYGHGRGISSVLILPAGLAGEIPGFILREVNPSCRCLDETEPMKAGDVLIWRDEGETTIRRGQVRMSYYTRNPEERPEAPRCPECGQPMVRLEPVSNFVEWVCRQWDCPECPARFRINPREDVES